MIIMRGLPGSGKTYYAQRFYSKYGSENIFYASADSFFMSQSLSDNVPQYRFDVSKIGEAHESCKLAVLAAVGNNKPVIIVDNTNSRNWEMSFYVKFASLHNYKIEIYEMTIETQEQLKRVFKRRIHDIPLDKFLGMWWRWEACNFSPCIKVEVDFSNFDRIGATF